MSEKENTDKPDYIIVSGSDTQNLAKNVNQKIGEHYLLVGPPFVLRDCAFQAMTLSKNNVT